MTRSLLCSGVSLILKNVFLGHLDIASITDLVTIRFESASLLKGPLIMESDLVFHKKQVIYYSRGPSSSYHVKYPLTNPHQNLLF
jgi:hypothetical protein